MTTINNFDLKETILKYKEYLVPSLSNSIDHEVLATLINMLALHYGKKKDNEYLDLSQKIVTKILQYLGERVIISYDFSITLGLFAIAISDYESYDEDITENIKKSQNKTAILNQITNDFAEGEITPEFIDFIDKIIGLSKSDYIINYIAANKKKVLEIHKKLSQLPNLMEKKDLHKELLAIIKQEAKHSQKAELYKNSLNMFGIIATGAILAAGSIFSLGLIAPIVIIPATIYGLKACAKPIETSTIIVSNFIESFNNRDSIIEKKIERAQHITPSFELSTRQDSTINMEVLQEAGKIISDIKLENAQNVKIKKEHSKEIVQKVESIKKNINQRQS